VHRFVQLQLVKRHPWISFALLLFVGLGAGCSTVGYYAQSVRGHFAMLHAARPIDEVLADPATDAKLRAKLARARDMRRFASRELALPDNGSYMRYADLKRPFVIWNVFATPELSLKLDESCFPVTGCVGYRGYFSEADAQARGHSLAAQGKDVNVGGVPAYSTLGWFDDPLLNTFLNQPDGEVARLIFHELAHQVFYVSGDTTFNESFATAVENAGVARWLASQHDDAMQQAYVNHAQRKTDFLELLLHTRERLALLYASQADDDVKRAGKAAEFARLKADYEELKQWRWAGYAGYDRFFAQSLNNAHLAAIAAYSQWVPAFARMLSEEQGNMGRFLMRAKALSRRNEAERVSELARLCPDCAPR
jgi:predicted aminopeptidase